MAQVPLEVRITVDSAAVKKALRGIVKETTRVESKTRKEIEKTKQARTNASRKAVQEVKTLEQAFMNVGKKAGRELSEGIFTGVKRGRQRAMRYMKANRGSFVKGLGATAVAGAFAGRQAFQTARSITGAPTIVENIGSAKDFQRRMTLLQNQSQMTDAQMGSLQGRLVEQGSSGTLSPSQLLAGVEAVQRLEGADAIPAYLESMADLSNFSEGLGANFEDLSKLSTILQRQFGITAKQMPETIGLVAEAGVQGSIEIENFARQFPRVMGVFAARLNRSGVEGVKEFAAVAQAGATMFPDSPEQSSRAMRSFVNQLVKPETRKILSSRGLDPQTTSLPDLASGLAAHPLTDKQMAKAFPDSLASSLMVALVKQFDEGTDNVMTSVMNASGTGQLNRAQANTGRVRADAKGRDQIRKNTMQGNMIGAFEGTASAALRLTDAIDMLTSAYPGEVLVAKMIFDFASSLAIFSAAMKILGGGKLAKDAVGTVAKGGGKLTKGVKAVGALGGGVVAAVALPAALALGTGALLAHATDKEDEDAMERFARRFGFDHKNKLDTQIGRDLKEAAAAQLRSAHVMENKLGALPNVGKQDGE